MPKPVSVEDYLKAKPKFSAGIEILRKIINSTELKETIKWGAPVYTLNGKNVLGLAGFKNHFGIWFFNGVFLKDNEGLLINAQENKTKALRQMRFESTTDIDRKITLDYVLEAIENQKQGKEIKPKRSGKTVAIPKELKDLFDKDQELNLSFKKLSPAKQREYCSYISEAKRKATKTSRLNKIVPMINKGSGLYDKYKNC